MMYLVPTCPLLLIAALSMASGAKAQTFGSEGQMGRALQARSGKLPVASGFDLTSATVRTRYLEAGSAREMPSDRFALPELSDPPMPTHKPAKLRIRGKKVKLRLPLG